MNDLNEEFAEMFQGDDFEDDAEDIAANSENDDGKNKNDDTVGFEIFELSGSIDNVFDDKLLANQEEEAVNGYLAALRKAKRYTVNRMITEEEEKAIKAVKESTAELCKTVLDEKSKELTAELPKVREYTNKAEFEKINYAKPVEAKGSWKKKLLILLIACFVVGCFLAVKANSYFVYTNGKTTDGIACTFSWLMADDMPYALTPFNSSIFMTAFGIGAGLVAIVGIFIYLESEQKRQSRVGHEHGNARLGTASDFKKFKTRFMDNNDNNMLFGMYQGQQLGLSLNNKKVNRSANVLVIGGTGTGKTFKYIKPNILQENCSMVVTDPSGDIFRSFAPYLLSKGYNVYLFNASDFTLSNHYNPLLNVYDSNGEISEQQVDVLVNLYMKNAKAGKESGSSDPFWDKSEQAFLTALIYFVLENDNIPRYDKCFNTILKKVQLAKVEDDECCGGGGEKSTTEKEHDAEMLKTYGSLYNPDDKASPLTREMNAWFAQCEQQGKTCKAREYYDTFLIAPQKTANTILITTAVDLQIFATKTVDNITRLDEDNPAMNIDIDKMATQQSYLFLGIPQSHQAYNFLIAMLYSQLYGRMYDLGERKLRGKYHIGYTLGTPVFDYFNSEEEAKDFYQTVTKDNIIETDYINGTKIYNLIWRSHIYKTSVLKEPLEKFIDELSKMYIWAGDDFAGGDPSLPIHINFLLDEFKNIGEIPNFLTILSTSRKYRIGSHVVIQDIGQLKTMYKDGEHETVMANVDTTIFLGSILKEDKEEIQKMLGKTTIRQKSTSSSNSGLSTSYTPTEVDLMSIDQISAINQHGRDDELVIIRDVTPYLCRKLNLMEHKRWKDVKEVKKKNIKVETYYRNNNNDNIYKPTEKK